MGRGASVRPLGTVSGRSGAAAPAQGGWPPAGAGVAGLALACGLLLVASVVLGAGQRLGWLGLMPSWLHGVGIYGAVALGGFWAGRLAGRRGAVIGFACGLAMAALAVWWSWYGAGEPPAPEGMWRPDWAGAFWRAALAGLVGALAGALAMAPW